MKARPRRQRDSTRAAGLRRRARGAPQARAVRSSRRLCCARPQGRDACGGACIDARVPKAGRERKRGVRRALLWSRSLPEVTHPVNPKTVNSTIVHEQTIWPMVRVTSGALGFAANCTALKTTMATRRSSTDGMSQYKTLASHCASSSTLPARVRTVRSVRRTRMHGRVCAEQGERSGGALGGVRALLA
jgi:hypothetical protein